MNLAEKYIDDVLSGKELVCELTRLAIERHVNDLENGEKRGLFFDNLAGEKVIAFVKMLKHTKGAFSGKRFNLQGWQAFILWSFFGWKKKATNKRRFRKIYLEVARKNGKTEFFAAIGLYMLLMDREVGAEVYSAATKRDQARKIWDAAATMLKHFRKESKSLMKFSKVYDSVNNRKLIFRIQSEDPESIFVPLSQDYDSEEGSNPSCALIDEYHLHKTSGMRDMLNTGMGARHQPLLGIITTAGFNTESVCKTERDEVVKTLRGELPDDSYFGIIYTLDKKEDWDKPEEWIKANPNIASGAKLMSHMENEFVEAQKSYRKRLAFKVKELNIWENSSEGWDLAEIWKECGEEFDPAILEGRDCYAGLDLASTKDLASVAYLFPPAFDDEPFYIIWKNYCPQAMIDERKDKSEMVDYHKWVDQNYIIATEGNVTDYQYIENDILEDNSKYNIKRLGFDRHRAYDLIARLQEWGIKCNPVPQTFAGLSAPTEQLELLVRSGNLNHGNNPVASWAIGNVVIAMQGNDYIKPDRKKKLDKIDPIAAALDAINVYLNFKDEDKQREVYKDKGVLIL